MADRSYEYSTYAKLLMVSGVKHVVEELEVMDACIMTVCSVVLWNAVEDDVKLMRFIMDGLIQGLSIVVILV